MGALKPGDQVMVERDPYDETSPSGYATVIRVLADYQRVDVQFEPVTVSTHDQKEEASDDRPVGEEATLGGQPPTPGRPPTAPEPREHRGRPDGVRDVHHHGLPPERRTRGIRHLHPVHPVWAGPRDDDRKVDSNGRP